MSKNMAMLVCMLCLRSGTVLASVVEVNLKNSLFTCDSATCQSLPVSDELLNASFEWDTAARERVADTMSVYASGFFGGFEYLTTDVPGSKVPQFVFQDSKSGRDCHQPLLPVASRHGIFFPTIGTYPTQALIMCGSPTDACGTGDFSGPYHFKGEMDVAAVPEAGMAVEIVVALIALAIVARPNRHTRAEAP